MNTAMGRESASAPMVTGALAASIVDTYDAITTDRPYRASRSASEAIAELRKDALHGCLSAQLVEAFVAVIKRRGH